MPLVTIMKEVQMNRREGLIADLSISEVIACVDTFDVTVREELKRKLALPCHPSKSDRLELFYFKRKQEKLT